MLYWNNIETYMNQFGAVSFEHVSLNFGNVKATHPSWAGFQDVHFHDFSSVLSDSKRNFEQGAE